MLNGFTTERCLREVFAQPKVNVTFCIPSFRYSSDIIIFLQAFCTKLGIPDLHWLLWYVLASFRPSDISVTCHRQGYRDPYVRSSLVGVTPPPIFRRLHHSRSHVALYLAVYHNNGVCLYQGIQSLLQACWGKPFVHIV